MSARPLVLRYMHEVWVKADPRAVERLLAEGYVDHDPPPGFRGTRAEQVRAIEAFGACTRRRTMAIRWVQTTRDTVVLRHDMTWVQTAPLFGLPLGKVRLKGFDLYVVRLGRIAESWHVENVRAAR